MKSGSELLNKLLELRNQMKVYHWQTKMYSRHKASDKFLEKANTLIDNIIEGYQGKYKTIYLNSNNKSIKLDNIKDDDIEKYLITIRKFFVEDFDKYINKNTNTDLLNLRDELIANINITLYLFKQNGHKNTNKNTLNKNILNKNLNKNIKNYNKNKNNNNNNNNNKNNNNNNTNEL